MSAKKHGKKFPTDRHTDYLFDYFMNEDKIDEQLRGQLDEELAKKIENHQPKLDSRVMTEKGSKKVFSTEEEPELPSISPDSEDKIRPNVDFNDDDDDLSHSEQFQNSTKSLYGQKINAAPAYPSQRISRSDRADSQSLMGPNPTLKEVIEQRSILGEKIEASIEKHIETPEERRARAREAYGKLQDLVDKHQVKLTKSFSIDDDPDEMEAEHNMHKERRHKHNQVKFYKQILLNIVCGVEFLNEKYNPFEFKLKDWSKQIASDMDDYTEVLEEIYEKYKDKGGKMAPEIRLLFMIIMSGVTFHLSQALFGAGGLGDTIQNNPNILNKLFSGLMKGGGTTLFGGGNNNDEPVEAKNAPPNNKNILAAIRKHQNKTETKTDTKTENANTTEGSNETSQKDSVTNEALVIEKERRLLAEQRAAYENQLRKQQEIYTNQIDDLKNQLHKNTSISQINIPQTNILPQTNIPQTNIPQQIITPINTINNVLSDATKGPRFKENSSLSNNHNTN